ncbi:membrane protease family protein BA0301 [Lentilactobacillus kosonis]|uniref:Membrane protease family protein BA0301 n=1 Tax=Lentilactobacillus kosonis TaxID=2810561 RepID=A0A401FN74_9LACO|nr:membrane protease family protein BA0301 [Lentilactobacillus kosonis]
MAVAGIEIVETRLTHLAYATEIASAMLQRQQSTAILSARKIIVEGAVSIAEDAVSQIETDLKIETNDDKRLQLVNNVLVSIINEKGTQNVINTDSLD